MNILLYRADKESRNMIAFSLESHLQAEVYQTESFQQTVELLLEDQSIDLIVCDYLADTAKLFKYILSVDARIPIVILTNEKPSDLILFPDLKVLGILKLSSVPDQLFKLIQKEFQQKEVHTQAPSFCRIKTELLLKVAPLSGDIFIRLSSIKFVKIFRKGDVFDREQLNRILFKKKVEYLYIKKDEAEEFVEKFRVELSSLYKDVVPDAPEKTFDVSVSVHETVHELTHKMGFTTEVQDVAREQVKVTLKSLGDHPKLSKVLELMSKGNERYISSHSVLLANVACCIAAKMKWPSDTTFQKLTLAAFCHDLSLDNQKLAAIQSLQDLEKEKENFTPEEIAAYRAHPYAASDFIKKFSEIPGDVDVIVSQHHERPDGSGFPRGLTSMNIAPLASLFIVAHEMVDFTQRNNDQFQLDKFIDENRDRYTTGTFKKVWQALTES